MSLSGHFRLNLKGVPIGAHPFKHKSGHPAGYCANAPQRLSNEPVGIVGWAPFRRPALLVGRGSGGAALASCAGAAGRIAPALCFGSVSVFALAADAVCVVFGGGLALRFGSGVASGPGSDFKPTARDMRSITPPELEPLDENRLLNQPPPEEELDEPEELEELDGLVDAAAATRVVTTGLSARPPVGSSGARGGEACAGMVPGSETPGERTTPEASV